MKSSDTRIPCFYVEFTKKRWHLLRGTSNNLKTISTWMVTDDGRRVAVPWREKLGASAKEALDISETYLQEKLRHHQGVLSMNHAKTGNPSEAYRYSLKCATAARRTVDSFLAFRADLNLPTPSDDEALEVLE